MVFTVSSSSEEALYIPTFSHLLIVNKLLSLALSLSRSMVFTVTSSRSKQIPAPLPSPPNPPPPKQKGQTPRLPGPATLHACKDLPSVAAYMGPTGLMCYKCFRLDPPQSGLWAPSLDVWRKETSAAFAIPLNQISFLLPPQGYQVAPQTMSRTNNTELGREWLCTLHATATPVTSHLPFDHNLAGKHLLQLHWPQLKTHYQTIHLQMFRVCCSPRLHSGSWRKRKRRRSAGGGRGKLSITATEAFHQKDVCNV